MPRPTSLTSPADLVLRACAGDAPLPELADAWPRAAGRWAAPHDALAPALTDLVADGLVEVRRFRTWPSAWESGVPVDAGRLAAELRHPGTWLPGPARDGLLVARRAATSRRPS
ncbi:hypothetical protein ACFY3U_18290 [Micromonospora sp. NPDC000089]|uniref:hypothetical protein n=1 Tax=unclassified Micromonospora TaxID=2617518 RepID=UPI003694BE25